MEVVVYRQSTTPVYAQALQADGKSAALSSAQGGGSAQGQGALSPGLFYPQVTEAEMVTWTYWLPTSLQFDRALLLSPTEVISTMARLQAPVEVVEEFHWAWKMDLFETYEIRTPVRQDARDPLLLGHVGGQTYRLALWGESLRPLEQITALVQQSFEVRSRAAKRRLWFGIGGTLPGLALATWLGYLLWEGQAVGAGLLLTFLFFFFAWLPMLVYTPENCQHDFLDRYRC